MFKQILLKVILLPVFLTNFAAVSANGLKFNGSNCLIDERTSFDVFSSKSVAIKNKLIIEFNIAFLEPSHLGYITQIKNQDSKKAYNLSYYVKGDNSIFKLNEEGGRNLISIPLSNSALRSRLWIPVAIVFDMINDEIHFKIDDKQLSTHYKMADSWLVDVFFGRSGYLIDVPSFAIKDLYVSGDRKTYHFPLDERKGNIVHDIKGNRLGIVSNPVWLINDSYYWQPQKTIHSSTEAGYNVDLANDVFFAFNKDSLYTYNLRTGRTKIEPFVNSCPVELFLSNSFLRKDKTTLYVYEVCNENKKKSTNVAALDLTKKTWRGLSEESLYMQLHHHSTAFDIENERYYIFGGLGGFGGFGNLHYSRNLFSYDLAQNRWDSLRLQGDNINPRYFSSLGYDENRNCLYVFGGMGNE